MSETSKRVREFDISREREDKQSFIEMEKQYFACDAIANHTLHIEALTDSLTCLKHMINLSWRHIDSNKLIELRKGISVALEKCWKFRSGGPQSEYDTLDYLKDIHEDISKTYQDLKEALI